MSWESQETSVEDGAPVEIYTFEAAQFTYRLTGHDEDVSFGSLVYESVALRRGHTSTVPVGQTRETTVMLPVDHELVAKLRRNGIPVRNVRLTIATLHSSDGGSSYVSREQWRGDIASIETDEQYATVTVPASTDDKLAVRLPIAKAQRQCSHMLYSVGCGIARSHLFHVTPTVSSSSGVTIVVSSMFGQSNDWAKHGEVVRVIDGERRTVLAQSGTTLTIDVPFGELEDGDALEVWAGCDWLIETCRDKFFNVDNFGGQPDMPTSNPTAPTGYGVIVQT